jgi:hypothetical protein
MDRLAGLYGRGNDVGTRRRGEGDAHTDPDNGSRATGGVPQPGAMDQNSTTGTTPSEEFVGRAGGDETGDVGLSGGEGRTGNIADGRTGAARDE